MKIDTRIQELIGQVNDQLKGKFGDKLDKVIVFGSFARGDYDHESDLDILALVEDENPAKFNSEIVEFEVDLTIKYGVLPSIVIRNAGYFNENKDVIPFFRNVAKEGVQVYAA